MEIRTATARHFDRPPPEVFDFLVACETLPRICLRYGPIAAIVRAAMVDEEDLETGAHRLVEMDDGVQLDEEILAFERSSVHEYAWTRGLKPPLSWMVTRGQGRWDFSADGEGTRVQWSYCFTLSSPLAYPVGWAAARFFRTWMVNALLRADEILASQ